VDEVLGLPAGRADGLEIALLLDREFRHRLAGLADAVGDPLGPARLDADHHDGGDVGVGARADHGAEMQFEILAELQAAIGMRDRQRALDVVGDSLAGGVGDVVDRQDDDVVAHADPAVLAAVALDRHVGIFRCHGQNSLPALGFAIVGVDVPPLGMSAMILPMSSPYLMRCRPP
jgi:hypothetical protein